MKKNRGFTLAELLGVITIVAVLCLITFPSIVQQIRGKEVVVDNATKEVIFGAVEIYMDYHENTYPKTVGSHYCITLQSLVADQILEDPIKNAKGENISLALPVGVTVKLNGELMMTYNDSNCIK